MEHLSESGLKEGHDGFNHISVNFRVDSPGGRITNSEDYFLGTYLTLQLKIRWREWIV